jgi:co-chaperonin GroES (HSP10)
MKITPLDGKLIAEVIEEKERTTESGIILTKKSAEQMRFVLGKVVAAAEYKWVGEKAITMRVKVGDVVYFDEYTTKEFMHRSRKLYCLDEDKIYGIVDPSELEDANV